MKYWNKERSVVVNASGGYAALERLGFKPESQRKEKEMEKKKKSKPTPTIKPKAEKAETKGESRNKLMLEVKARGIKNYRVMNKAELSEIAAGAKPDRIKAIQKEAVERWKSGWAAKKKK